MNIFYHIYVSGESVYLENKIKSTIHIIVMTMCLALAMQGLGLPIVCFISVYKQM